MSLSKPYDPVDPISAGLLAVITLIVWPEPVEPALVEQVRAHTEATSLSPARKSEVIDKLLAALHESYVFPEVASRMDAALRARLGEGAYSGVEDGGAFARALTEHLQAVSHDKHLRVRFSAQLEPERSPKDADGGEDGDERDGPVPEEFRAQAAWQNFGFERVERLPGNVGYLDLREFLPPEIAGDTAAAAMGFLANSDALIIDLRENGGGTPEMVAFLSSYLFGPEPVHLNDLYFRPEDRTDQFWTLREVPGKRLVGTDTYVLTSAHTFSAAEEFAYNLRNLKRATIVGEQTGGGANPGGRVRLDANFAAFVPSGRAINPITKTNWEGVGVEPDVRTSADLALKTAHALALDKLLERGGLDPERKSRMGELRDRLRAELSEKQRNDSAPNR